MPTSTRGPRTEWLLIEVNDLGNTDLLTPAGNINPDRRHGADGHRSAAADGEPEERLRRLIDVSRLTTTPPNRTMDEDDTAAAGLIFSGMAISDRDDLLDAADIPLQVTLDVLHGGLAAGDDHGPDLRSTANEVPRRRTASSRSVPGLHQRRVFRGTMADLNAALASLAYYPDANFNTETRAERLVISVNDLGNTDVLTPAGNVTRRGHGAGRRGNPVR